MIGFLKHVWEAVIAELTPILQGPSVIYRDKQSATLSVEICTMGSSSPALTHSLSLSSLHSSSQIHVYMYIDHRWIMQQSACSAIGMLTLAMQHVLQLKTICSSLHVYRCIITQC